MSSDAVHGLEGLSQRVQAVGVRSVRLVTLRDQLVSDLAETRSEIERLSGEVELLTKVGELFRMLMDKMVTNQVHVIEQIVTEGLQSIFHDLDLYFESEIGPKYNKIAVDFYIRQGPADDPLSHRGRPLEAFGGGPTSVASLTLRVLSVLRLKLWPFLILDEALGAVSDEYTSPTARFLQTLAAKMNMDILLVTHKPAFTDHADLAYRCAETIDGTSRSLVLKEIK